METSNCLRCRSLLSAAMDGEATFNETEFVRRHLGDCADCREAQQAYNSLRAQLRLLPTPAPPVALRTAVMSRINGRKAVYTRRKPVVGLHPLLNPWQKGIFAAAVLVLVFVSGFILSMMLVQPFEVAAQPVADITDQKVVIIFTRPVDRNYIMANAPSLFSIKDSQNNPLQIDTANIVIDGNRVELPIKRDSGQLQENEQIQIVVAPQLKDDKGAAVENPGLKVAIASTQQPNVAGKTPSGQIVAVATSPASPTATTTTAAATTAAPSATSAPAAQSDNNPTTAPPRTTAAQTTAPNTTAPVTTVAPTTAPVTTGSPTSTTAPVTTTVVASPTVTVTTTAGTSPSPSPTGSITPTDTMTPGTTPSVPPSTLAPTTVSNTSTVAPTTSRPSATPTTVVTRTPVISTTAPATVPVDPSTGINTPAGTLTPSTTVSTPAASPTQTAASCKPVELGQGFEKLYLQAQDRIGCPTSAPARSTFTYQVFQKGSMLYYQQTGRIYVFYNFGGWASYRATGPVQVPPTKVPPTADPSVTPSTPTPDPTGCSLKPRGSFGTLWSNNQAVQSSLGCPVDVDSSAAGGLTQNFARGMMLYNPLGSLPYAVVYSDGGFQAYLGE